VGRPVSELVAGASIVTVQNGADAPWSTPTSTVTPGATASLVHCQPDAVSAADAAVGTVTAIATPAAARTSPYLRMTSSDPTRTRFETAHQTDLTFG
jgi:hypothetical protein